MSEGNGSTGTPKPLTIYDLVRDLDEIAEAVAYHEKHLAAARLAERRSRERITTVLRGRGGKPFSCGGRLFRPLHSTRGYTAHDPGIVDFEAIEYDPASSVRLDQVEVRPGSGADADLKVAAAAFASEPPADEPPPFGVEPRDTVRELVRSGRPVEALTVLDDDGEV